jgi:hypothetical protein
LYQALARLEVAFVSIRAPNMPALSAGIAQTAENRVSGQENHPKYPEFTKSLLMDY